MLALRLFAQDQDFGAQAADLVAQLLDLALERFDAQLPLGTRRLVPRKRIVGCWRRR